MLCSLSYKRLSGWLCPVGLCDSIGRGALCDTLATDKLPPGVRGPEDKSLTRSPLGVFCTGLVECLYVRKMSYKRDGQVETRRHRTGIAFCRLCILSGPCDGLFRADEPALARLYRSTSRVSPGSIGPFSPARSSVTRTSRAPVGKVIRITWS